MACLAAASEAQAFSALVKVDEATVARFTTSERAADGQEAEQEGAVVAETVLLCLQPSRAVHAEDRYDVGLVVLGLRFLPAVVGECLESRLDHLQEQDEGTVVQLEAGGWMRADYRGDRSRSRTRPSRRA